MTIRRLPLSALFIVALAGSFALPDPADARGRRRNYADEWKQEERAEERREEREEAREDWLDHSKKQQKRAIKHNQRQLDTVIDHHERTGHGGWHDPTPAAPSPPRKKRGTCIYGEGDKVLYQPDGVECNR